MVILGGKPDLPELPFPHELASMEQKIMDNLQARTEAKLRCAEVHLVEIEQMPRRNGDDFDRAPRIVPVPSEGIARSVSGRNQLLLRMQPTRRQHHSR